MAGREDQVILGISMRKFVGILIALALSACATSEPADKQAVLQNAVFVAGDQSAPVQPTAIPDAPAPEATAPKMTDDSTLKRLYWFLGGR